jgi:hypothetical protein
MLCCIEQYLIIVPLDCGIVPVAISSDQGSAKEEEL